MELIVFLIWTAIVGLIIGALGRLAIPGPNPMGIGMTILVGIGGALLAVAAAALIVYVMQRRPARTRAY